MGKISRLREKWRDLSWFGKISFFKSMAVLPLLTIGLKILPFSSFRKLYSAMTDSSRKRNFTDTQIEEVIWAVNVVANNMPVRMLCLPRALVTKYLLRHSDALTLQIGVDIEKIHTDFTAHAWVERNGRIIIGEWPTATSYQTLWAWE